MEEEAKPKPEVEEETNPKPQSKPKGARGKILFVIISCLWLPISFILPYSFTHHMASQDYTTDIPGRTKYTKHTAQWRVDEANSEALRSGVLGVLVALAILAMWRLDLLVAKDRSELKSSWMVMILGVLAMFLWLVWTCAGHLMIRAHDEVHTTPAQLPGFE